MKRVRNILTWGILTMAALPTLVISQAIPSKGAYQPQNGDIIFQSSNSMHSQAIKLATHSEFSHVGMVFSLDKQWMVLEAVEPVQIIPLRDFIQRGEHGAFEIKRLQESAMLTSSQIQTMTQYGRKQVGKHYDIAFNWDEDRMYCSELVWKVYQQGANIELCKRNPLKSYDLSHPIVKSQLKKKYGKHIPMNEPMVSPQDLFDSAQLTSVYKKEK